ncbi:MAG: SGNH/GDSL hydrolase family protein [Sandaracinaceae bacterium]|nr:SGNH/GDSL hydrolase family protein [Sandaracinaceae bacterium]
MATPPAPRPKKPGGGVADTLKKLALLAVTSLVTVGLGECGMHVLGIGQPQFHEPDPTFGVAPIAGAEGEFNREGHAHVRITEHGYRGVDHPREKPAGTFRLVVLGDSYTEARQVELEESFSARLEEQLATCPVLDGRPLEVLNFGVAGYGTAQEYLTLRERALAYSPDAVMLAFLTGNDVTDNHPSLRFGQYPYYELRDGELVLNDDFRDSEWFRSRTASGPMALVRRYSRIYQLLNNLRGVSEAREQRGELGLNDAIYSPPASQDWNDAWAVTEALLARMNRELRADGRPFFVVTLSNALQVDPDPAVREAYRTSIGAEDLFYPDHRVAEAGARDGYPVLNLAPPLREHAEREHVYLHGFDNTQMGTGHWNATGHRVASELMARWLCEQLAEPEAEAEPDPQPQPSEEGVDEGGGGAAAEQDEEPEPEHDEDDGR